MKLPPVRFFEDPDSHSRIRKQFKKLPLQIQEEVRKLYIEIEKGQLPRGRRLKKIDFFYQVRLNRNFRMAFSILNGTFRPLHIGPHSSMDTFIRLILKLGRKRTRAVADEEK